MKLQEYKNKRLRDTNFRETYEEKDLPLEMAKVLIDARLIKGYTQAGLAKKMKTGQSSVARSESGDYLPSLSWLARLAELYETELVLPTFKFMIDVSTNDKSGQAQGDLLIVNEPVVLEFYPSSKSINYASEY